MNKSESIKELAAALAKAQAKMPAAKFNATNPFLKNKYADLGAVIDAARQPLAENGLSVSQLPVNEGEAIGVTTILMHSSGEYIESTLTLPVGEERGKSTAQVAGSVITYLRRYALASVLGIYADEDTDGNQPAPKPAPAPKEQTKQEAQPVPAPKSLMTVEMAKNETNRDGVKYGDLETPVLTGMANKLREVLDKNGLAPEEREEKQRKLDAALVILKSRQ